MTPYRTAAPGARPPCPCQASYRGGSHTEACLTWALTEYGWWFELLQKAPGGVPEADL